MPYCDGWRVDECGMMRGTINGSFLDLIARKVCDAAGMDGCSGNIDWEPLAGWLAAGLDAEKDIIQVIREAAATPGYKPPTSLDYFEGLIRPVDYDGVFADDVF